MSRADSGSGDARYGAGRFIDPDAGILSGEGAEQVVPRDPARAEGAAPFEAFTGLPSRAPSHGETPTYYERPVLKEPTWIWAVPAYFYAGGVAGAAATLGGVAQVVDRAGLEGLVGSCRWISAVGCAVGSALLIYDLGRPERFANMLRVFRPTSPMSVGSWVLAGASSAAGPAALTTRGTGVARALGDVAGLAAAALGPPLSGYTAVLLSNTAVPLWQGVRRSLPGLFMSSAGAAAASLLDVLELSSRERSVVRRFGNVARAFDLLSAVAVDREARAVERVGRPLHEGAAGALWKASKALTAASLALSLAAGRARWGRLASALSGTAGAVAVRFAVFHAGMASSRDPRATFEQQRAGVQAVRGPA